MALECGVTICEGLCHYQRRKQRWVLWLWWGSIWFCTSSPGEQFRPVFVGKLKWMGHWSVFNLKTKPGEIPWWPSGKDSILSLLKAGIQSLVMELRSPKLHGQKKREDKPSMTLPSTWAPVTVPKFRIFHQSPGCRLKKGSQEMFFKYLIIRGNVSWARRIVSQMDPTVVGFNWRE